MKKELKQFISYFFVGGVSAIVEWISFFLCNLSFNYNLSTIVAFILATTFNYILGRKFTFKDSNNGHKDMLAVFGVSFIGLLLNILFMNILLKGLNISYEMVAKIISTGLVFMWNYLVRKIFIYKK